MESDPIDSVITVTTEYQALYRHEIPKQGTIKNVEKNIEPVGRVSESVTRQFNNLATECRVTLR